MISILDYLKAGYPIIWIQEKDEMTAIRRLSSIAKKGKTLESGQLAFNIWSCTNGLELGNKKEDKLTRKNKWAIYDSA